MSEVLDEIQQLIAPNLRRRLYVAFHYLTVPQAEAVPHIPEHLRYMAANEAHIFLSGPIVKDGDLVGDGLTVLQTDNESDAVEFLRNEPFIRRGMRRFELKLWELREGSLTIETRLTSTAFTLK
jgi:uncharacterized protein YciI